MTTGVNGFSRGLDKFRRRRSVPVANRYESHLGLCNYVEKRRDRNGIKQINNATVACWCLFVQGLYLSERQGWRLASRLVYLGASGSAQMHETEC